VRLEAIHSEREEETSLETGKRKTAIARAVMRPGKGRIYINDQSLDHMYPEVARMKIEEPLLIAGDRSKAVDIRVSIEGGGVMAQAEAARIAIAGRWQAGRRAVS